MDLVPALAVMGIAFLILGSITTLWPLEKSQAKLERGFVHVGQNMETEEKGLYAIGDIVAGMPQLAHAAMMEGIIAVTHIAGKPTQVRLTVLLNPPTGVILTVTGEV